MLHLIDVDTFYGPSQVLHHVALEVNKGEIVCLLGANAAGKTTTQNNDDEDDLRAGTSTAWRNRV